MKNYIAHLIVTFFGSGFNHVAPASFSCLMATPLIILIACYQGTRGLIITAGIIFILGFWAVRKTIHRKYDKNPAKIVIDDVLGLCISLIYVAPKLYRNCSFYTLAGALAVAFMYICVSNIFKIMKHDEKVLEIFNNAFGVMLDDILVAGYTILLIILILGTFDGSIHSTGATIALSRRWFISH